MFPFCFPGGSDGRESAFNAGDPGREVPLERRAWQPTPVFLPGEFHGQRSLVGYSQFFLSNILLF